MSLELQDFEIILRNDWLSTQQAQIYFFKKKKNNNTTRGKWKTNSI
jgi:hypothetical protein